MDDKIIPLNSQSEELDSSPSVSSPSESSSGSSLVLERILAVGGAILLRWFGKLDQEWAALVLASAFSGPLIGRMMRALGKRK